VVLTSTATLSPNFLSAATTVYDVVLTSTATISPNFLSAATSVYSPVLTSTATVSPNFLNSATSVNSPVLTAGEVTVSPNFLSAATTVNDAVLTSTATVSPNFLSAASTVYDAVLTSTATVSPGFLSDATTVQSPVVTQVGPQTISPGSLSTGTLVRSPGLTGALTVSPNFIPAGPQDAIRGIFRGYPGSGSSLLNSADSGYPVTVNGGSWVPTNTGTSGLQYSGSSPSYSSGLINVDTSQDVSISVWFKPLALVANAMVMQIMEHNTGVAVKIYYDGSNYRAMASSGSGASSYSDSHYRSAATLSTGNWYHVSLSAYWDSGNFILARSYMNGVAMNYEPYVTNTYDVPATVSFGSVADGSAYFFNGVVGDAVVANRVWTATEHQQLYSNPQTPQIPASPETTQGTPTIYPDYLAVTVTVDNPTVTLPPDPPPPDPPGHRVLSGVSSIVASVQQITDCGCCGSSSSSSPSSSSSSISSSSSSPSSSSVSESSSSLSSSSISLSSSSYSSSSESFSASSVSLPSSSFSESSVSESQSSFSESSVSESEVSLSASSESASSVSTSAESQTSSSESSTGAGVNCSFCSGVAPAQWQVDFTGIAEGTCGSCNTFNTTSFVLDYQGNCVWKIPFSICWPLTAATSGYIQLTVFSNRVEVDIVYDFSGVPSPVRFKHTGAVDCETTLNPTYQFAGGGLNCVFSAATCTATPL